MQFDSLNAFIDMGGHGLYVWMSYGATLLVLVASTLALRGARRKQLERLRWMLQSEQPAMPEAEHSNTEIPG